MHRDEAPPPRGAGPSRRDAATGARLHLARLSGGPVEFRLDRRGPATALICHGGHLRAGQPVGEEVFAGAGMSVLAPSRPGYGATPAAVAAGPEAFAVQVRELWRGLGLARVDVVVGYSAGAPLAVALAAAYPDEVGALVLQSGRSSLPWPDPATLSMASALFDPLWEGLVWAGARAWMGLAPDAWLIAMLQTMSRRPAHQVLADLSPAERVRVRNLFSRMRSGQGFRQDVQHVPDPALERAVRVPSLVVASPDDAVLPFAHAEHLAHAIDGAELVASPSLSHLLWFGSGAGATGAAVAAFLQRVGLGPGASRASGRGRPASA